MQIYNEYKYTSQQIEQSESYILSRRARMTIKIFIILSFPLSLFHETTYNISCNDIKTICVWLHINPAFSFYFSDNLDYTVLFC